MRVSWLGAASGKEGGSPATAVEHAPGPAEPKEIPSAQLSRPKEGAQSEPAGEGDRNLSVHQ